MVNSSEYFNDQNDWKFDEMANDFIPEFEKFDEEAKEYIKPLIEQQETKTRPSLFSDSFASKKVARTSTQPDSDVSMKGISRICRAVECLQNLRNFVDKRDNSILRELFDKFDEQLSLEIESHLTRRITKLTQM